MTVKSADRTLDVLETLAEFSGTAREQPTLAELARHLGIPKSSLHGVLHTLRSRGWVRTDGSRFTLGLAALRVGAAYVETDDTVTRLQPVLDDLSARFGETVHLGRLDGTDVVYLAKRESVHPLRLFSAIGRRLPAHATALGKALLARRSDAEVAALLPDPLPRLTAHTLTSLDDLRGQLATIRRDGYAVDREENSEGIVCVAVAATDVDAISVSVPVSRLSPTVHASLSRAMVDLFT